MAKWWNTKPKKSQVETRSCLRCRLGAKPGPHLCPCQPGRGVQQVWLEGGHKATVACPSTKNQPLHCYTINYPCRWGSTPRQGLGPSTTHLASRQSTMSRRAMVSQTRNGNIFKNMMKKIPLQILQKTGIILSFILTSKGPLFHPKKSGILVSYPLYVSFKARYLIHNKGHFHKSFHKRYWGSDKRRLE